MFWWLQVAVLTWTTGARKGRKTWIRHAMCTRCKPKIRDQMLQLRLLLHWLQLPQCSKTESSYSAKSLHIAMKVFDVADKYRGFYSDSIGSVDELLWGASWVHRASQNSSYLAYIKSNGHTLCAVHDDELVMFMISFTSISFPSPNFNLPRNRSPKRILKMAEAAQNPAGKKHHLP
ncbi:hypothetical protein FF1_026480 [Malus domestica]